MKTKTILMAILTSAALAAVMGSAHGQQVILKKAPAPAAPAATEQKTVVQPPPPAARPSTPPARQVTRPAAKPAPEAVPRAAAAPQTPQAASTSSILRDAAARLREEVKVAKSNSELAKIVAASDVRLDERISGSILVEPRIVHYVEEQSLLGGLFGGLKARMGQQGDPAEKYIDEKTDRGEVRRRKLIDMVSLPKLIIIPGATNDIVDAVFEYANARNEVVDVVVSVDAQVEAMKLQNTIAASGMVRSVTVKVSRDRFVAIDPVEGNVRDWKQIDLAAAPAQPAKAAPGAAPVATGGSDLCPNEENFFSRGICEVRTCKERADLAGHPTCVKIREQEAASQQQQSF